MPTVTPTTPATTNPIGGSSPIPLTPAQQASNQVMTTSGQYNFANGSTGTATEPSVLSTGAGKTVLNSAITAHNTDVQNNAPQPPAPAPAPSTGTTASPETIQSLKDSGAHTAEELKAAGFDMTNQSAYTYDSPSQLWVPSSNTNSKASNSITDTYNQQISSANDTFKSMMQMFTASEAAIVSGLQGDYAGRVQDQMAINAHQLAATNTDNIRGGTSRYASGVAGSIFTAQENYGLQKLADIKNQLQSAIATADNNLSAKEYTAFMDNRAAIDKLNQQKTDALNKLNDANTAYQKNVQDTLQKAKDAVTAIALEASKNGADPKTIAAISASKNVNDAISAAGDSLRTSSDKQTNDYLQYKRDTVAKGLVPQDFTTWRTADNENTAKLDASKAYGVAYNTALGKAEGDAKAAGLTPVDTTPTGILGTGTKGGSILNQTGLSIQAFNFLTQGTSALTRMTATERAQYMGEANAFLKNNNLDNSTFQSQYKAYNDVLAKNVARAAQTKVMAGEVSGTVDSFIADVGNDFGNINLGNVAKLWAGSQFNDPTVQKYAFQLQTMRNDLAGYYAAARGATAPELQDMKDAENVIKNGLSSGNAQALKTAVDGNEVKVNGVVQGAVDSARQSVWGLFGVGGQYQTTPVTVDPVKEVNTYISSLPKDSPDVTASANRYGLQGWSDAKEYAYLKANGKIK